MRLTVTCFRSRVRRREGREGSRALYLAVEALQIRVRHLGGADMVEDVEKDGIALPVDLSQLYRDQLQLLEDMGLEEESGAIERTEQLTVFLLDDRLQLVDIADEQQLFASERLAHAVAIDTEHLVDEVNDVGPDHAHLVDDDQFKAFDDLDLLGIVLQGVAQMSDGVADVIGNERMKRNFEEAVERGATGVDGGNACRSENDVFLLGVGRNVSEKSRFTSPRLSCEEKRAMGKLYDLESLLHLRVLQIDRIVVMIVHESVGSLTLQIVEVDLFGCLFAFLGVLTVVGLGARLAACCGRG